MTASPTPAPSAWSLLQRGRQPLVTAELKVEGRVVVGALALNGAEHQRRRRASLRAVTDRRLLHALWGLPEGVPWPRVALPEIDNATLADAAGHGWVDDAPGGIVRRFRPAGEVAAVITSASSVSAAIRRASSFPPIMRRYALVTRSLTATAAAAARVAEVGVARAIGSDVQVLVEPPAPHLGVPAVYRWWLAESVYAAWLTRTPTG